jgi:hypothetical protein
MMARVATTLALTAVFGLAATFVATVEIPAAMAQAGASAPANKATQSKTRAKKKAAEPSSESADAQGSGTKARDPAEIQKVLAAAQKSLDSGKADIAATQIDSLIGGGGLGSRSMAQALAIRGQAYRQQGKPAQAIADLQSALWLKGGLSDSERAKATEARAAAYREAGLAEPPAGPAGKSTKEPARQQASNVTTAAVASPPRPQPPVQQSPAPEGGSSGGGFFSNLFGGGQSAPADPRPAPAPQSAPPTPAVSSWSEDAARGKTKPAPARTAAVAPPVAPKKPAPKAELAKAAPAETAPAASQQENLSGRFHLRLAAQRTEDEAKSVGARIARDNPGLIGSRKVQLEEAVFGGMGTFYRAFVGPYADEQSARAACAQIRGQGVDCQVVTY